MSVSLRRFVVWVAICVSFGGFSFYAAVVVPIGADVLDSVSQGFVTRRVTAVLNPLMAVTAALLAWDVWTERRNRSRREQRVFAAALAVIVLACAALFGLHPVLSRQMVDEDFSVSDPDRFYRLHQAYLWVSTLQWLAFLVIGAIHSSRGAPSRAD